MIVLMLKGNPTTHASFKMQRCVRCVGEHTPINTNFSEHVGRCDFIMSHEIFVVMDTSLD